MATAPGDDDRVLRPIEPSDGGPTVLRILLGAQLRRLREAQRISLEEAGNVIRASHSKISRIETGRVGFKDRDIADLLLFYGVTDEKERDALRALARRASMPGWWHDYSDILPTWFEAYVGLEEAATTIRTYQVQFVPGLLQTADYARAVTILGHPNAPAREIDRRVGLRLARQALLTRPDPPSIWVVLDEAVLRRQIGSAEVMRGQVKHLLELSKRPHITIQVLPFAAGGHAAAGGPFSILRFAEHDLPDVVYLEQLTSSLYLDKQELVESYLMVMEQLCLEAATPAGTTRMLRPMLREGSDGLPRVRPAAPAERTRRRRRAPGRPGAASARKAPVARACMSRTRPRALRPLPRLREAQSGTARLHPRRPDWGEPRRRTP
jgi:transcriptional regulator with XRE-family HTH domain